MIENEILKYLDNLHSKIVRSSFAKNVTENEIMSLIKCKEIIKEIQQYRPIGTVEECQEARERLREEKPTLWGDGVGDDGEIIYDMYDCPNCGKSYEIDYEEYKHCPNCGQAFDLSDIA